MQKMRNPDNIIKPVEEALADWYELTKPLENLGFKLHSLDPGVCFRSQSAQGCLSTFSISVPDLRVINKALQ